MMADAAEGLRRQGEISDAAIVPHLCDAELSRPAAGFADAGENRRTDRSRKPDSIHIATEGPIGLLVRRYCRKRGIAVHHELPYPLSGICFRAIADPGIRGSGRGCAGSTGRVRR